MTIELLEELRAQNQHVTLFCNFINKGFVREIFGPDLSLIFDPAQVDISKYDLVFINHQSCARFLPFQSDEALFGPARPIFVYNHMSPIDLFERPGPVSQERFADLVLCNSPETRDVLSEFSSQFKDAELWPNPAPTYFDRSDAHVPPPRLERLLCVSNHLPDALSKALHLIRDQGVEITQIGRPKNAKRLTPEILQSHDAVVTIGKTVQYALRARVPVFCYDRFSGPGWLSEDNFDAAAKRNFSGRSHPEPWTPETLAESIIEAFPKAAAFANQISPERVAAYKLEDHVARLLTLIEQKQSQRVPIPQKDRQPLRAALRREREVFRLVDQEYAVGRCKNGRITGVCDVTRPSNAFPITASRLHPKGSKKPSVFAMFSYRYDAGLVPAMLENIAPMVDGWVAWDDRNADKSFTGDATRQRALFEAARDMGADWVFAVDPDERFEDTLSKKIEGFIRQDPACWTFQCREMYSPDTYRTDGLWGRKPRLRLFPCQPGMEPDDEDLHGNWTRNDLGLPIRDTGLNFYHLRMATPERRQHRRDIYAIADPGRLHQKVGYDYLADDRGCVLETIPEGREYSPIHVEDGALWSPPVQVKGCPEPDPVPSRLRWLTHSYAHGGQEGAFHVARDISERAPDDFDMGYLAARLAVSAGLAAEAQSILQRITPTEATAQYHAGLVEQIAHLAGDTTDGDFTRADATWRRWVTEASIHEGRHIPKSDLAAIVLGLRAPAQLAEAVRSLREQDQSLEIIVVNSDGGDPESVLRDHLDHIRLINVGERLYPGGARNVGIDASSARFVSFLASDCLALPGWASGRIDRHRAGAKAVASAVVATTPDNIASTISNTQLHWARWPGINPDKAALYGVSYARTLFADCGYFPTGGLIGEDTQVNQLVNNHTGIAWAPEVQASHRYPTSMQALWKDMKKRGYNRAFLPPFSGREDEATLKAFVDRWIRSKTEKAHLAIVEHLQPSPARLKVLLMGLRLAARAERAGVSRGGREVFQARALMEKAAKIPPSQSEKAQKLLRRAIDLMHANPVCHATLARHLIKADPKKHIEEIIETAYKLAALDPRNSQIILELCEVVRDAGRIEDAHRILKHATLAAPERIQLWWARASYAEALGDVADQYDSLQNHMVRAASDAKLHEALARLHAGQGDKALSSHREALAKLL